MHLNNAGAALMPQPVLDAMIGYLRREGEIGGYETAAEAAPRLDAVYGSVARLIGAAPDEVALTENATVAWQMGFYALAAGFRSGDRILTTRAEYAANYVAFLQVAHREGEVGACPPRAGYPAAAEPREAAVPEAERSRT